MVLRPPETRRAAPVRSVHLGVAVKMSGQRIALVFSSVMVLVACGGLAAQDRLPTMPGYDNHQKMSKELSGAVKYGAVSVTWKDEGKAFDYTADGKLHRFDIATGKSTPVAEPKGPKEPPKGFPPRGRAVACRRAACARGRQSTVTASPDGQFKAFYRDRNLWLSDAKGLLEMPITTDGSEKSRIKNGSASWVYGEELVQRSAMWWSPDSKKVAFYRFDETNVPDYYLALNQTALMTKLDAEPYPKPGAPNPVVDLLVYDLATKKTVKLDIRDGKPFADDAVGHYAYRVSWAADGKQLLFERTNRRQNVLEFVAADPVTGKCRVVVREEWPASWVENLPQMRFLKDGLAGSIWASGAHGQAQLLSARPEWEAPREAHGAPVRGGERAACR